MKTKARYFSLFLVFAMLLTSLIVCLPANALDTASENVGALIEEGPSTDAWIDHAAAAFAGGNGSSGDPYIIKTPEQMAFFALKAKETKAQCGYYVRLDADIDMGAYTWTYAIGDFNNGDYRFTGDFNGNGHTINNLRIETPAAPSGSKGGLALFHTLGGSGAVHDLKINGKVDVNASGAGSGYGGCALVVTALTGSSKVTNVTATADVTIRNAQVDYYNAGIIVAHAYNGTLTNCVSNGTVTFYGSTKADGTAAIPAAGGLTGYIANKATITNCTNNADIYVLDVPDDNVVAAGGIGALQQANDAGPASVTASTNNGKITIRPVDGVTLTKVRVGGIVGTVGTNTPSTNFAFNISNCANYGAFDVKGTGYLGGVVGYCETDEKHQIKMTVSNCISTAGNYVIGNDREMKFLWNVYSGCTIIPENSISVKNGAALRLNPKSVKYASINFEIDVAASMYNSAKSLCSFTTIVATQQAIETAIQKAKSDAQTAYENAQKATIDAENNLKTKLGEEETALGTTASAKSAMDAAIGSYIEATEKTAKDLADAQAKLAEDQSKTQAYEDDYYAKNDALTQADEALKADPGNVSLQHAKEAAQAAFDIAKKNYDDLNTAIQEGTAKIKDLEEALATAQSEEAQAKLDNAELVNAYEEAKALSDAATAAVNAAKAALAAAQADEAAKKDAAEKMAEEVNTEAIVKNLAPGSYDQFNYDGEVKRVVIGDLSDYEDEDDAEVDFFYFNVSKSNITDYDAKYVALATVKISMNGSLITRYTPYDPANARSVSELAKAYEQMTDYDTIFTDSQRSVIETYAPFPG